MARRSRRGLLPGRRQLQADDRALSRLRGKGQTAAVLLEDAGGNRQPKARAAGLAFGGEKGVGQMRQMLLKAQSSHYPFS